MSPVAKYNNSGFCLPLKYKIGISILDVSIHRAVISVCRKIHQVGLTASGRNLGN
jgi:hypothetical protein